MKHPENIKPWQHIENVSPFEVDANVNEGNWWGWGVALNTCAAARKVTKVWKGRIDGDGSVSGGSRAALIQNDGAPLAVRIAALKYPRYQKHPKAPTITFYPQNWLHSALLKQHRVASTEFEKKFDPRGREGGEGKSVEESWREGSLRLVRFPSPGVSSINCSQLQCWQSHKTDPKGAFWHRGLELKEHWKKLPLASFVAHYKLKINIWCVNGSL